MVCTCHSFWKNNVVTSPGMLLAVVCRPYFKASVFAKLLGSDPYGRISVMQFFNYIMRKVWLHQTRIGLSLYDVAGLGFLRESVSHIQF